MSTDYQIKRHIFNKIKKHLSKKEITIVSGIRQCGKSTVLQEIKKQISKDGKKTIYLNFDFEKDKKILESQEKLINRLEFEFGNNKAYVFIDEIQRKENAGLYLKGIYDLGLPYKFLVSGSGSVELKEKIQESLAGRKRIFEMTTVNFPEFADYKTNYKYSDKLDEFFDIEKEQTLKLLNEYLNFGGFPRVVTEDDVEEKTELINEIFNSYIEKDLISLLNINKPDTFKDIFSILAYLAGNILNLTTIASDANTSVQTLKNYLYFAEKTFSIRKIRPYYKNIAKEIRKSPVYYFTDIGLLNYSIGRFGNLVTPADFGFVFQNMIYNALYDVTPKNYEIKYWRTTDKAEVDFVIDKKNDVIPIEVKYKHIKKKTISRSFRSFIEKYKPSKAYIINLSLFDKIKIDKTEVIFIPFTKIFFKKSFKI